MYRTIDELLATVEVANETAQSEIAAYGTNFEAFEPAPRWFEVEPDDGLEQAFRLMYANENER